VNDHDFRSDASGVGISYGIYDPPNNRGTVCVGVSHDTPAFAVHSIATWWKREGSRRHDCAPRLLVLADSGGSNGCRSWAWKTELQAQLCNPFGITATVAHHPTGASKWNPIEHRLFSEISKHWAAEPLSTYGKMLGFIRNTKHQNRPRGDRISGSKRVSNRSQTESTTHLFSRPQARQNTTAMELQHRAQSVNLILRLR
jgi:Rhodopirellula transposase DDE domain